MKKILSFIIAVVMLLTIGVTAFAAEAMEIEAGKTLALAFTVDTTNGVKVVDVNNTLTVSEPIVTANGVYVNVTAKADTVGKITKVEVRTKDGKTTLASQLIEVVASPVVEPVTPIILDKTAVEMGTVIDETITIAMNGATGISAEAYNWIKNQNFEKVVFVGENFKWTLTRGDYTKMNVTAPIYFDVKVDTNLWTEDKDGNVVEDYILENKVLKALGNTQIDVFYVIIADNCNIANVAANAELEVVVDTDWFLYAGGLTVDAFKFDGESATRVAKNVPIKYVSGKLVLNTKSAGTYVFVDSTKTVDTTPSTTQKPNASTGANSMASSVVAIAVMGAVAVGTKFIVK